LSWSPIIFAYPEALLLGLALVYLYWRFVRNKNIWRTGALIVGILLLCYPSYRRTSKSMDLYLLVDRSRSIAEDGRAKQNELISLAARNLEAGDRLGIVTFNDRAYIEQAPSTERTAVQEFQIPYSEDASDLAEGIATVLNIAPEERRAKILVLSDGEYTGQDPLPEAQRARQRQVPLFYRDLKRTDFFNMFVAGVDTPEKMLANEPFRLIFRVHSTVDGPGRYRLYRDNKIIGEQQDQGWRTYNFRAGENRIPFTDSLKATGIHAYKIEVEGAQGQTETVTTDNRAEKFVSVVGERPVLVVNNAGQADNVSQVLSAGGLQLHIADIDNFKLGVNQLEGYKGVVLNNVAITKIAKSQIDGIRDFVQQEGGGLLVCGGNNSFAAGGYYKTSIDAILPVSLEDRKQAKKVSTAFSFVIDRSGSMAVPVPSGQKKIELANAAAIESLNLLSGADSISVIPVDSAAHIFVEQQNIEDPAKIASEIRKVESMGGGIFVYTGLVAAGNELLKASQLNKHILLFSDANDSEEPGDYKVLLEKFKEAGITVSVVGLGKETDVDAEFLKDIAARGDGQIYFTEDAHQLIQFFTADTITYTRKSFVQDPAPMKVRGSAFTLAPEQQWQDFSAAGYNLLFSKEQADVAIATADADNAPVLAFWQRGLGRVASLALDAEQDFSTKKDYPDIVLNTVRWIMGSSVYDNLQVRSETEGSYARITMEVGDDERGRMGEAKLAMFSPNGTTITLPMQWESHNRLAARVKLEEMGLYRGVVMVGDQAYKVGPVSMPVSPEFAYERGPTAGHETLNQLANITGGKEVLDVRTLFDRGGYSVGTVPLLLPLLIGFLIFLLGDIVEARFAPWANFKNWARRGRFGALQTAAGAKLAEVTEAVSASGRRTRVRRSARKAKTSASAPEAGTVAPAATVQDTAASANPKAATTQPEPAKDMDYLSSAKQQARRSLREKK